MTKYSKIVNITNQSVNFFCAMPGSGSKGILLNPGELVIVESVEVNGIAIKTSILGVQERRKLVIIEENFNNSFYDFPLYKNLKQSDVNDKINFLDAQKNAENYMGK